MSWLFQNRFALVAVLALAAAPKVSADSITLDAVKDNTLIQDAAGTLSNGAGEHIFAGRTSQSDADSRRRALIAFDLTSIPLGSTVNAVTLTLHMSRTRAGNQSVSMHRLLADWGEATSIGGLGEGVGDSAAPGDATWLHRFSPATLWTTAGGDFFATASATQTIGQVGFYSWGSTAQLVSDVQGWVDLPSTNFGWLLRGGESATRTAKRFDGRDNTIPENRPKLMVTYTPGPAACCLTDRTCVPLLAAECTLQGGTPGSPGSICIGDPDGDGVDSSCGDNCPSVANPGQEDTDSDGLGNACDCGDGLTVAPEQCDGGTCCTPQCTFVTAGTQCRSSGGVCDVAESCTGSNENCPPDSFLGPGLECRPSAGLCDLAESCTGNGAACPPDGFVAAGEICRPLQDPCDVTEACTGISAGCPANGFLFGDVCRHSTGPCDPAETCPGDGPGCPTDEVISVCADGDGCCPVGCCAAGTEDSDCPQDCGQGIPTVSEWGVAILALLLLAGAKVRWGLREGRWAR